MFGQDADHEMTEAELALKKSQSPEKNIGLFQKARGKIVIFHSRKNKKGEVEPAQVEAFNPKDPNMEAAINAGEAVVVDLKTAKYSEDAMEMGRLSNGNMIESRRGSHVDPAAPIIFTNGVPSMRPEAQDVGGLLAPGTERAM